ncbi:MAG TPA: hypothetical protein VGV10_06635 [Thermoleophilaceae bacterium]|nr:hypothetical protein [Thermoleophilaceae bacterium]
MRVQMRPDSDGEGAGEQSLPACRRRERAVQELAAGQLGLVPCEQLVHLGFSKGCLSV